MPHVIYVAYGFPPAAKSSAYRLKATANLLADRGCDVTVITVHDDAWLREFGLDTSLLRGISPRVEYVKVPVDRADLDPDITRYSWWRARFPARWLTWRRRMDQRLYPEPVFGRWRPLLEKAALDVHRRKPADLVVATSPHYTSLAAAWRLWRKHGIPYVIDYRDGWSIDVVNGVPAFRRWSRRGRWESRLVRSAARVWCVNQKIREFYAARYPHVAQRIRLVRNGWDPMVDVPRRPRQGDGLTFGYVGTGSYPLAYTAALLDGWRLAREQNELLARSSLTFRGHFGLAAGGAVNSHRRRMAGYSRDNVNFGGPVTRDELARVYAEWDALVFMAIGGPYVTSGKIYEYMATGLPILSVHRPEHGAHEVLDSYPLWTPPPGELTAEGLAESFVRTAELARDLDPELLGKARDHAAQYARDAVMSDAIDDLMGLVADARTPSDTRAPSDTGGRSR